jgi:hypothetical protein
VGRQSAGNIVRKRVFLCVCWRGKTKSFVCREMVQDVLSTDFRRLS